MTSTPISGSTLISGSLPSDARYDADIIILAMDRVDETLEAIASALAQQGISRHVLVFDQGSTEENLKRLGAAVEGRGDACLMRAERNWGVAGGRNRVSALGHGRVIVALDNDAEFETDRTVARAVAKFDSESHAEMEPGRDDKTGLGAETELGTEKNLAAIGFRIVIHSSGADDLSSWGYPPALLSRSAGEFGTITFVGAGHAISRRAWDACGGYDEKLFFCWEEYDFCLKAISQGWRMEYAGDLVVRHKVSPDRRFNWSGNRWFYYVRNRLYIGRKWQSWPSLAPRIVGYLLKGVRNGLWMQTLHALPAAWQLSRGSPRSRMPARGAEYIACHDSAHRGTWRGRLKDEVFAALPGHGMKAAKTTAFH